MAELAKPGALSTLMRTYWALLIGVESCMIDLARSSAFSELTKHVVV